MENDNTNTNITLCAWCGTPIIKDNSIIYNNDYICMECSFTQLKDSIKVEKLQKGEKFKYGIKH